ncbi:hypothetical protein [Bradyrhizobium tropiciagri]|uniref:hypothetical protein n=1 Tax=Bradyrhizobium tropiciagri TaxID=312253 RepID=UPI001009E138|nr:hypothetical protein [Bradyrhizobium tropiciagri]
MVYKFDPIDFNGTTFELDETSVMVMGSTEFLRQNLPIAASYFPKALTFDAASARLPDMFHMSRGYYVFSERARTVIEHWAPNQVEFIPVACTAKPKIASVLNFDSAYYFINVLGRAQRLQWREMEARKFRPQDDGIERFGLSQDFHKWKLRERVLGEPLIWHDAWWRDGNREYRGHVEVLIEDVLWRELDANFPDQLHPLRAGEH